MTAPPVGLAVRLSASPASGWRARFRPSGPAGHLMARLPFNLTVWLDAAEPWLALEIAGCLPQDGEVATALLRMLFGAEAADALSVGTASVGYAPDRSAVSARVRMLIAKIASDDISSGLGVIEVAALADSLRASVLDDGSNPPLARLLGRIAISYAARAVAVLRLLPERGLLRLEPAADQVLDRCIELTRNLIGEEVEIGQLARPDEAFLDRASAELVGFHDRLGNVLVRNGADPAVDQGRPIEVDHSILPVGVEQVFVRTSATGEHRIEGVVRYGAIEESGQCLELSEPVPEVAAPEVWARAIRRADRAVLYAARCLIDEARLTATLYLDPDANERSYWIELVNSPDAPVLAPRQARGQLAQQQGVLATVAQRRAYAPHQWAGAGALWLNCAELWLAADDAERHTLAAIHAARAYLAAGPSYADAAALAFRTANRNMANLDPRWLAPSLAARASRDDLDQETLIGLSRLGAPVAEWVAAELNNLIAGPVPSLRPSYLRRMLIELPELASPGWLRIRLLRARARIALAYHASQQLETLPLASVLMAAASAEWPYLDGVGRERYAAVNLALLGAATAADGVGLSQ